MSLFNRIAGTEETKIPVWPVMMDLTRVMDNEPGFDFAAFAAKYALSAEEQAEAAAYMQAIGALITSEAAIRIGSGWPQASAVRDARVSVDAVLRYGLLRAEQGTITEAAFQASLGMGQ